MTFSILESILSVLFTALAVTVIFRQLRLPVILGYFLVGALMGPHALGLIPNLESIKELAEFGIVFLMFTVGLEFSQPRLFSLKRAVFVIGGLQVLLTILITTLIGIYLGMSMLTALVVGGIAAMSSTAIVVKQLHEQLELQSRHGSNAVGILLFQDLAVIPFIILIAGLSENNHQSLTFIFLWALLKGAIAIVLISMIGKWLLRPLFHVISKTRTMELFTLTVLLVTLTAAWITNMFGLSFALGAFLAGIMLSETEFRHQIENEIRPFRDILLGLFFITIGMLTDISHWSETWIWILLLLTAIVVLKMLLIIVLSRFTGNNDSVSLRTGLILAQGGEFGFAILTLALNKNILPPEYGQVVLAALLISIALSPLLIGFNKQIAAFLLPKATKISNDLIEKEIVKVAKELDQHIVICGYGRVGQHIARLLDKANIPHIGLDIDSELIGRASLSGYKAIFGDATHPGILGAANLGKAKALVISFNDFRAATKIVNMVRPRLPHLPILVRCKDEVELSYLKDSGATRVIAEIFEESLTLSHHLLQLLHVPTRKISELLQEVRNQDYSLLRKVFPGSFSEDSRETMLHEQLRPIVIPEGAYAVNHKLSEFNLREGGVEIIAIRRGSSSSVKPRGNIKLHANDIIIAYGSVTNLEDAERKLLEGD